MLDLLKIRKKTGRHKTLAAGVEPALPRSQSAPAPEKPDPAAQRKPHAAPPRAAKAGTQVKREADPAPPRAGKSHAAPPPPVPAAKAAIQRGGFGETTDQKDKRVKAPPPAPPEPARPAAEANPEKPAVAPAAQPAAFAPPSTRRKPPAAAELPEATPAPSPDEVALVEARTTDDASLRHLLCRVHQETFAVPISDILEILRERTLTPLPLTARALAGILSLRGRMVPVVDAALRLGFTPFPSDENCRIVVFEIGEEWIGLRVAAVGQVTVIDPEAVQQSAAALGEGRSELTSGVLRIGTQFVTVPVLQQLLDVTP